MAPESTPPQSADISELDEIAIPPELQRFLERLPCSVHSKRLNGMEATLADIKADTAKTLRALIGEPDLKRPGLIDIAESNVARIGKLESDRATAKNEVKGGLKTITSFGGVLAWAVVVIGGLLGFLAYFKHP